VGVEDGRLVRAAYPAATYGLLSRLVRPGSTVQPLATRPEGDRRAHVHATAFTAATGERTLVLVNDHPEEEIEVELALPPGWPPARCRRVGAGVFGEAFDPRVRDTGGAVRAALPPLTLAAFHDEPLA
jgi:hypothetical protein